jgi:NAD(P)H-dependent FMN reductase
LSDIATFCATQDTLDLEIVYEDVNELLNQYDGFIVSLAEHNGSYAVAFKNIFDWVSRIDRKVFRDKPLLLMSTSPGGRGGASVLDAAKSTFPHLGADIIVTFSLPNFYDNFKDGNIVANGLKNQLQDLVKTFEGKI